jgi:hypothetical protein
MSVTLYPNSEAGIDERNDAVVRHGTNLAAENAGVAGTSLDPKKPGVMGP